MVAFINYYPSNNNYIGLKDLGRNGGGESALAAMQALGII
jgi:hypothetical protein